jgi:hypothetical protein
MSLLGTHSLDMANLRKIRFAPEAARRELFHGGERDLVALSDDRS